MSLAPNSKRLSRFRNAIVRPAAILCAFSIGFPLVSGTRIAYADDGCIAKLLPADEERLHSLMHDLGLVTLGVSLGEYRALYEQGIGVAVANDPKASELAEILLTAYRHPVAEVVRSLDRWLVRHSAWKRIALPADIRAFGEAALKRNEIKRPPGDWILPNGLVDSPLYALLIADGSFPVADPHDLLAHLLSLSDPAFDRQFRAQMDLNRRVAEVIGYIPVRHLDGIRRRPHFMAYVEAYRHLQDFVRNGTQENWTFLLKDALGKSVFHGQGNMPFNGYRAVRNGDGALFIQRVLNGNYAVVLRSIAAMPGIGEFRSDPARARVFARYEAALRRQAADPSDYVRIDFLLKTLVPREWRIGRRVSEEDANAFIVRFVSAVEGDAFLSDLFSYGSRLELYEASNAFYRSYLDFADRALER